jgi:hypothetical protein
MEPSVYRFITSAGEVRYGEVKGIRSWRYGSVAGVVAVARDVTGRVMAQGRSGRTRIALKSGPGTAPQNSSGRIESLEKEIGEAGPHRGRAPGIGSQVPPPLRRVEDAFRPGRPWTASITGVQPCLPQDAR